MDQLYQVEADASLGVKRRMEVSKVLGMHEQKVQKSREAVQIGFIQKVKSQIDAQKSFPVYLLQLGTEALL